MSTYITADTIRTLREQQGLTQRALAEAVGVTDKAVSNWESGRGLPDISLIESLAAALGVSVAELLTGDVRQNANRAGNMLRSRFYVCPICGNVVHALGEGSFSCCGSQLISQEAEEPDEHHNATVTYLDGSWHVLIDHPMT
ncbi:helix-turn-helix domain-containing protein, partial [Enorma massiliensis]